MDQFIVMNTRKALFTGLFSSGALFFQAVVTFFCFGLVAKSFGSEIYASLEVVLKFCVIMGLLFTAGGSAALISSSTKKTEINSVFLSYTKVCSFFALIFLVILISSDYSRLFELDLLIGKYWMVVVLIWMLALFEIKASYYSRSESPGYSVLCDRILRPVFVLLAMLLVVYIDDENSILLAFILGYGLALSFGYMQVFNMEYKPSVNEIGVVLSAMKTSQISQSYLTNFFSQVTKNIDIFLAAYFFSGEMLAVYALGSRVAQLFGFIYSGYMAPLAGQIVNAFASKATKSFWKFIAQNMAVILLVMLVAYCVSYFMLDFVVAYSFGEGFGGVFEVFFVLSLASLLNCLSGPTLLLLRTCGYASYAFYSSLLALVPYVYMLFHPPTSLIDLALYPVAGTVVMKSCSAVFLYTNHYKGAV